MQTEIIIAGFGGQGVLFAGLLLARAGMQQDKHVTWIPSYGPEMRGGTAHVTVIISDEEIGSPIVRNPDAVLALNNPSLEKYEPLVKANGVLAYNSSLILDDFQQARTDITYIPVPASEIATTLGGSHMMNVVTLGALIAATNVLPIAAVEQALHAQLGDEKQTMVMPNVEALRLGAEVFKPIAA